MVLIRTPRKLLVTKMSSSIYIRLQGIFAKRATATLAAATFSPTEQPSTTSPEIRELVKKFKNYSKRADFRRRQDRFESAVRRLAAGNHFSAIETILECQKKYKDSMADEGFAVKLISLYGKAGMFDHACKVFDQLPHFGCRRTVFSFNALLSACVDSKRIDKLCQFFRDLPVKLRIDPNVVSCNTVIKAFCVSNDFDSAIKVVEEMEQSSVSPDTVSYNTILEAYYKENRSDEAEKFWQRMEEKGVIANVRTYNAKLRNMIQNDQVYEAMDLLKKMVNGEVKPDTYSYNAVIKGCVSSRKLEEAKILHSKMVGDACLPDHMTYLRLIPFACEKGDIDFALQLTKQALKLKVYVDRKLMQLVVDALIEKTKIEDANELVALLNSSTRHQYTITSPVPE